MVGEPELSNGHHARSSPPWAADCVPLRHAVQTIRPYNEEHPKSIRRKQIEEFVVIPPGLKDTPHDDIIEYSIECNLVTHLASSMIRGWYIAWYIELGQDLVIWYIL